jgi:predicted membrane chloride channel (bestrophin family)
MCIDAAIILPFKLVHETMLLPIFSVLVCYKMIFGAVWYSQKMRDP